MLGPRVYEVALAGTRQLLVGDRVVGLFALFALAEPHSQRVDLEFGHAPQVRTGSAREPRTLRER